MQEKLFGKTLEELTEISKSLGLPTDQAMYREEEHQKIGPPHELF